MERIFPIDEFLFEKLLDDEARDSYFKSSILAEADARKLGSRKMHQILLQRYPTGHYMSRWITPLSTLQTWIAVQKKNKNESMDLNNIQKDKPHLYAYVQMLDRINKAVYPNVETSNGFITFAERCFYRFNDPLGETVDLLAQWVVIREYYERYLTGFRRTDDLDTLLDNTPWIEIKSGVKSTDTLWYKLWDKEPLEVTPHMRYAKPQGKSETISDYTKYTSQEVRGDSFILGVYAHLGLPFAFITQSYKLTDGENMRFHCVGYPNEEERKKHGFNTQENLRARPLAKQFLANLLK